MRRTNKVYSYQINLIPDGQSGYTVLVPALPGCISFGKTVEQATASAREAIELHLENLAAHKEPIPVGHETATVLNALIQVTLSNVA
ncbi:MAG: type II toxin-antitoxin system HicB family antitoxin [Bryobacteraceae bacterium]|jgi:predicted RNase H-like HicB family nuclease